MVELLFILERHTQFIYVTTLFIYLIWLYGTYIYVYTIYRQHVEIIGRETEWKPLNVNEVSKRLDMLLFKNQDIQAAKVSLQFFVILFSRSSQLMFSVKPLLYIYIRCS